MYLFQRIEEAVFNKNDASKVIGEFILENRSILHNISMEEIAKQTYTSKPTLVRFAKYFGYSGWKEFMYAFTHEVANIESNTSEEINPNFPFTAEDDTLKIIENISHLKIQSIKDSISLVAVDDLNEAARIINEANSIVIYGTSPNYYYGELFKRNLLSIQKKALMADSGERGIISQSLTSEDCAIIISYSGNSHMDDPTNNIKLLRNNAVPIISITSGGENFLRSQSNITLNVSSQEKLYSKIGNFATQESILFILDILFSKVFSLNYDSNIENKISLSRILESERYASFKNVSEE